MRRHIHTITATGIITVLAATPAVAQDPGSAAGGSAVQVGGVVTVSGTEADTSDDGSADATVVSVGDQTIVGGSQEGTGSDNGEIAGTGETDQGSITVGGYDATVEEDRSSSESSVVHAEGSGEDAPAVTVLESRSEATATGGSRSSTTGARLSASGTTIAVLDSSASSAGDGDAAVARIDDTDIASSEQADGACEVGAEPVIDLLCLYARETGPGDDGSPSDPTGISSGVVDAGLVDDALTVGVTTTTATQFDDGPRIPIDPPPPAPPTTPQTGDPEDDDQDDDERQVTTTSVNEPLPITGGGLLHGLLGLAAMASAGVLRRYGR